VNRGRSGFTTDVLSSCCALRATALFIRYGGCILTVVYGCLVPQLSVDNHGISHFDSYHCSGKYVLLLLDCEIVAA
jgi:hypothetical protein